MPKVAKPKKAIKAKKPKVAKPTSQAITIVNQNVLAPEMHESKLALPKTWISEKQILKILQRTPKEHVKSRKGKGGKQFEYVSGVYMKKILNYVFGWLWDFEVLDEKLYGPPGEQQIVVRGRLTVKDARGNTVVKTQYGGAEVKYLKSSAHTPVSLPNDFKAAATDCLKKCAAEFGIASDVYGKQEFRDIGIEVQDVPADETTLAAATPVVEQPILQECHECGNPMTDQEVEYSKKIFNKQICRECQKYAKR